MWGVDLPTSPIIYSIFGIQHHTPHHQTLITTFTTLITPSAPSAPYIEHLIQSSPSSPTLKTTLFLAYWPSLPSYQAWWTSAPVTAFWGSLPPSAGMYREILLISPRRTQSGLAGPKKEGMAHVGTIVERTSAEGYWGCYRDRYDENSETNRMDSSLAVPPEPRRGVGDGDGDGDGRIREGRVVIGGFPENLCFVVEGQDHSGIGEEEKRYWFENFDASVTNWITDLANAPPSSGILDARLCYVPSSGTYRDSVPEALNYNRKIQLFYFLDHGYMERIGVRNKGHVALRNNFLASYCPAGAMGRIAKLMLWVETSVLKKDEIECEYVGCLEGTGFLAFDHLEAFKGSGEVAGTGWVNSLKGWIPWGS